jgi:nucleotide-binding universal stress UspA family protein
MSYILTAVYPADAGNSTLHYAARLAAALQLPLRIVYPYTVPLAVGEMPMPLLPVEEVRDAAQARLDALLKDLQARYPTTPVQAKLAYGGVQDVLNDEAGSGLDSAVLTVISNGEPEDAESWFGSESASALRDNRGLVLAVPQDRSFGGLQHVCVACDARGLREGLPLVALLRLKSRLGFRLTILHVTRPDGEAVSFEGSALQAQLAGTAAAFAEITAADEVDDAIAAYVSGQRVDWLAVAPHHYGFWEGLFHRSHTARLLGRAAVPVLALHD